MKLQLLDHPVEDARVFGDISVLDASVSEEFNVQTKWSYQRSSKRSADRIHEPVMLMVPQQIREPHTSTTEAGSTLQIMVHQKFSKCMEEDGGLLQPI